MCAWRVAVSPDCIAAGSCLGITPDAFALGADGRSHPIREIIEPDPAVLDSAASCPMEAIRVYDAQTGEPIEP